LKIFYEIFDMGWKAQFNNALRGYKNSVVPMMIYTITLWVLGLGGGIVLGLTNALGTARGAPGFWLAAIVSIWLVGRFMALYLHHISICRVRHACARQLDF
jgi:MATE family multidrug resistance protein